MSDVVQTPLFQGLSALDPRAGDGPEWLREIRSAGRQRFESLGLPSTRLEEWRNTNVQPIGRTSFAPGTESEVTLDRPLPTPADLDLGGVALVFLDGQPVAGRCASHDLGGGAWVGRLAEAVREHGDTVRPLLDRERADVAAFEALNEAYLHEGVVLIVPDGVSLDAPIHVIHVASGDAARPTVSQPRLVALIGDRARAGLVETFVSLGEGASFTNAVGDVRVGDGAHFYHVRMQFESPAGYHVATARSVQGRDSGYHAYTFDFGGKLVRRNLRSTLDGEGSECTLDGLYLLHDEQHVDNHTILDHAKPHGDSREVFKGILGDRSKSVFSGRIIVREDAQKTDAKQSNPNLLLSPFALAHTQPQLEIYADDVKCTHGATVGRLDEDAVFYLRSRGLDADAARAMMIEAFAGEILGGVPYEALRDALADRIRERLRS